MLSSKTRIVETRSTIQRYLLTLLPITLSQRFSYPVLENTAFVFTSTGTLRYWLLTKTKQDRALISAILFIAEPPEPPHAAGPSNWRQRYREEKENVLRALHTSIKLVFRDELEVSLSSFRSCSLDILTSCRRSSSYSAETQT